MALSAACIACLESLCPEIVFAEWMTCTACLGICFLWDSDDEISGSGYIVNSQRMTWNEGKSFCSSEYGTFLAAITNDDSLNEAWDELQENGEIWAWIGLNRLSGSWKWDGNIDCGYLPSNNCKDDPRWQTGEPTEGHEYCAYIGNYNGPRYNDNQCTTKAPVLCNAPPISSDSIPGKISICVKDTTYGATSTGSIEARLWYLESGGYKSTAWYTLGADFGYEMKGKCIDFMEFYGYNDKDWDYIDLHTCSDDGLAIDSIKYWDVFTNQYLTRTVFAGSNCIQNDYFWLEGDRHQCYAISVHLYSGHIYMDPSWVSGQNCQIYGNANNNPSSIIDNPPNYQNIKQNPNNSKIIINIDENIIIILAVMIIIIFIFCSIAYYCCINKKNKKYKKVHVFDDTDQEN